MSSSDKISLSIVIVNYNGMQYLADCLNSIARLVSITHEVIVVDNASTDKSCEYLVKEFPKVTLIANEKNLGFSAGNNIGVKKATGEYLLLLNNDTVLLTDVKAAIERFEGDETLGVLGGRLFYGDGASQFSFGFEHTPLRLVVSWLGFGSFPKAPSIFKRIETNIVYYEKYQPDVDWVTGAFLFTRRSLWEQLGGMDERYFMYVEEVDYCKRVKLAGFRVSFTPEVRTTHYFAGGKPWVGEKAMINNIDSYCLYIEKFHGSCLLIFVKLSLILIMLLRAFAFGIISLLSGSIIRKEKMRSYFNMARQLVSK